LHVLDSLLDEVDPEQIRNVSVIQYLRNTDHDALQRLRAAIPNEARVWANPVERIVRGRAYRHILAMADRDHANLIVMGVRGKGAFNRFLFGSTTEHIVREARCPVLTLHADIPVDRAEPLVAVDVGTPS
jgi:nucleotide-binding universal stress UspA family protein